jgi:hypothetical protein
MFVTNRSSAALRSDTRGARPYGEESLATEAPREAAPARPMRVMLASTEGIVLAGLARLFKLESDCELVASCQRTEQIPFVVGACRPDLLVMHLPQQPGENAAALLGEIRALGVPVRVVMVPSLLAQRIRIDQNGGTENDS